MRFLFLIILIPFFGISQNYKLVDESYPEVVMKKIDNDTIGARLVTEKAIVQGYVVYRQIKRLDTNKVYRFPLSFIDGEKKEIKGVLYYEADRIYDSDVTYFIGPHNVETDIAPFSLDYITDSDILIEN